MEDIIFERLTKLGYIVPFFPVNSGPSRKEKRAKELSRLEKLCHLTLDKKREGYDEFVYDACAMVNGAQRDLEIYEDGKLFTWSHYDDPRYIETVRNKLEDNENFTVHCFLDSEQTPFPFVDQLKSYPRFHLYYSKFDYKEVNWDLKYYNLIDGGSVVFKYTDFPEMRFYKTWRIPSNLKPRDDHYLRNFISENCRPSLENFNRNNGDFPHFYEFPKPPALFTRICQYFNIKFKIK